MQIRKFKKMILKNVTLARKSVAPWRWS